MKSEAVEVIRCIGNVFRDPGETDADVKQFKTLLGAAIIKVFDRHEVAVRAAQQRTGVPAADFSRIRNANLGRFTLDRLIGIINRLGSDVEVKLKVRPCVLARHPATA